MKDDRFISPNIILPLDPDSDGAYQPPCGEAEAAPFGAKQNMHREQPLLEEIPHPKEHHRREEQKMHAQCNEPPREECSCREELNKPAQCEQPPREDCPCREERKEHAQCEEPPREEFSCYEEKPNKKLPYPPAVACAPNEKYANLIRSSFSGKDSELTAIMSYSYQAFKFADCAPEAAKVFSEIAVYEMHHFTLLGKLLISLGGDPKFFCCLPPNANPGGWWVAHPSVIKYCDNLGQALKNNIAGEKAAIAEYKSIIGYVDDDGIRAVLKRIVLDEEEHLQALECLYSRFCS